MREAVHSTGYNISQNFKAYGMANFELLVHLWCMVAHQRHSIFVEMSVYAGAPGPWRWWATKRVTSTAA